MNHSNGFVVIGYWAVKNQVKYEKQEGVRNWLFGRKGVSKRLSVKFKERERERGIRERWWMRDRGCG